MKGIFRTDVTKAQLRLIFEEIFKLCGENPVNGFKTCIKLLQVAGFSGFNKTSANGAAEYIDRVVEEVHPCFKVCEMGGKYDDLRKLFNVLMGTNLMTDYIRRLFLIDPTKPTFVPAAFEEVRPMKKGRSKKKDYRTITLDASQLRIIIIEHYKKQNVRIDKVDLSSSKVHTGRSDITKLTASLDVMVAGKVSNMELSEGDIREIVEEHHESEGRIKEIDIKSWNSTYEAFDDPGGLHVEIKVRVYLS